MGFLNESDNRTNLDLRYETLRSYYFDTHHRVFLETFSEHQDSCTDWSEMHIHWIDLYRSISEVYESDYLSTQLLIDRYLELFRNLRWIATSVLSGAYDSAMRDLRFILEDICQATYIDGDYANLSIEEKYRETDGQERLRGSRLISNLRLNDTRMEVIKGSLQ